MKPIFIDPNIAKATTIDSDFYTDPACFEAAKEKIFAPAWQFAGSSELVKFPGDVYPLMLLKSYLKEPLMLTHDREGHLHCLSNVCTHRGNIVAYEACSKATNLRCKYHGRMFGLSGHLLSMPGFEGVENFPCAADNLPSLPLFIWGNLLFTTLHQKEPAGVYLKPMMDRLSWLPMHEFTYRPDLGKKFQVNAHWALYCENYLEGFHIPYVHATLNAALEFKEYTTELYPTSCLQLGIGKKKSECFDLPPGSADYGSNVAAYYFWIYPNMMFNFYPWGLSLNIVEPVSSSRSTVEFIVFMWKEDRYDKGAGSNLHTVEMEDEAIVERVQQGITSRFYQHGRYSVTRETGTHHFHRLLAESMHH